MRKAQKGFSSIALIVLVLVVFAIGLTGIYFLFHEQDGLPIISNNITEDADKSNTELTVNAMNFVVDVPSGTAHEEKFGGGIIYLSQGEIKIGRNGTNTDNLEEYFKYHPERPLDRIENKENVKVGQLDAISGKIEERYNYYIYVDNWVYIFSTSNPELYDDLDQIARSFRYIP